MTYKCKLQRPQETLAVPTPNGGFRSHLVPCGPIGEGLVCVFSQKVQRTGSSGAHFPSSVCRKNTKTRKGKKPGYNSP